MGIFGPSQKEIWQQFADEIGGEFIEEGFWKSKKVVANFENWTVTLDTFARSTGKTSTVYTRMRAPYKTKDEFKFKLYRKGLFSNIGKALGMQDIEVGYPEFDDEFIIKGNDETKIIELFSNDKIRELITYQDRIYLEIKDNKVFFSPVTEEGIYELYFESVGVIKDIDRLKNLFMLFILVLNRLTLIGSATDK
ncbi:MAG: DUF3137 domain-containing protein [Tissierellia bacterium]|nr:DUF3137 domain-containing protein [Tissierellia bacterium]